MKQFTKLLALFLVLAMTVGLFAACGDAPTTSESGTELPEWVDYAAGLKLNMTSSTAKITISADKVKQHIDGDTTHFHVPEGYGKNGILKARYLAVNTPESTGTIEKWGKKASQFTEEKLKNAVSIVIESDTASWNLDSTGDRFLVWVWYKTSADGEYINLNLQLLQEGLAIASNSANNIYGDLCMKAIRQAQAYKKYVYSDAKDPDFYEGEAQELTIKELRVNAEKYNGIKVAFEGVVVKNSGNNGVYVEAYDEETGMYNGIYVYYGFNYKQLNLLKPGNKVRIAGSMQFYAAGGTYQVTDLKHNLMDPKDPSNVQKLGEGFSGAYLEVTPETFANGKVSITVLDENGEEAIVERPYAEMALSSSISMKNLTVKSVYTTDNGGDSDGAMTLTCEVNGYTISVRTSVLQEDGELITAAYFQGKTIDVKGTVDYFDGKYQIEITSLKDVTIH